MEKNGEIRLYVSSATLVRHGERVDIQEYSFVTLARNADEARGMHVADIQNRFRDYAIMGRIATYVISPSVIREAARMLGMKDG
jgi:hypothetical protein